MVIGGLWHGASWAFVVWGALHGLYMVGWRIVGKPQWLSGAGRWLNILVTFHLVTFAWIFFRAGTVGRAVAILRALGRPGPLFMDPLLLNAVIPLALMLGVELAKDPMHLDEWLMAKPGGLAFGLGLTVALCTVLFAAQQGLQFIYFQF